MCGLLTVVILDTAIILLNHTIHNIQLYIAVYTSIQQYTPLHSHIKPYTAVYIRIQPYTAVYSHIQPYTAVYSRIQLKLWTSRSGFLYANNLVEFLRQGF